MINRLIARSCVCTMLAVIALCVASPLAPHAEGAWPNRPVTLIVAYPAGSATDAVARTVATPLAQKLGQPIVIENRAGADGNIAGRAVARAEANGYTFGLSTTTSWAVALNMQPQQMGFDPRKDFAAISLVGDTHYLLIVNAALGVNSVADLTAFARRSQSGSLNYSSTGEGSIAHLGMLILGKRLGIEMTHVPYKSTAQSIVDVASGVIQLQLATISPALPLIHAGKVRAIGIASRQPSPLLPDVPTLASQGADTTASFSLGFVFPAGTPGAIVTRLNEALREVLQGDAVKKALFEQGVEPRDSSPDEMAQQIVAEVEGYRKIVAEFGLVPR
ncbi:MAG: Bug family tripartite tricarboxylate transporter substrate binding protein [Xanthobacteraceae bacterium]